MLKVQDSIARWQAEASKINRRLSGLATDLSAIKNQDSGLDILLNSRFVPAQLVASLPPVHHDDEPATDDFMTSRSDDAIHRAMHTLETFYPQLDDSVGGGGGDDQPLVLSTFSHPFSFGLSSSLCFAPLPSVSKNSSLLGGTGGIGPILISSPVAVDPSHVSYSFAAARNVSINEPSTAGSAVSERRATGGDATRNFSINEPSTLASERTATGMETQVPASRKLSTLATAETFSPPAEKTRAVSVPKPVDAPRIHAPTQKHEAVPLPTKSKPLQSTRNPSIPQAVSILTDHPQKHRPKPARNNRKSANKFALSLSSESINVDPSAIEVAVPAPVSHAERSVPIPVVKTVERGPQVPPKSLTEKSPFSVSASSSAESLVSSAVKVKPPTAATAVTVMKPTRNKLFDDLFNDDDTVKLAAEKPQLTEVPRRKISLFEDDGDQVLPSKPESVEQAASRPTDAPSISKDRSKLLKSLFEDDDDAD